MMKKNNKIKIDIILKEQAKKIVKKNLYLEYIVKKKSKSLLELLKKFVL